MLYNYSKKERKNMICNQDVANYMKDEYHLPEGMFASINCGGTLNLPDFGVDITMVDANNFSTCVKEHTCP